MSRPLRGPRAASVGVVAALPWVLVLGLIAAAPAAAQSTPGDFWGAWVRANATWFATLPGPPTYLEQPVEGDLFVTPTAFVASAATRAAHPGVDLQLSSESWSAGSASPGSASTPAPTRRSASTA